MWPILLGTFRPIIGVPLNKPILMFCAALLTGCVGHYQQLKPSEPHATIEATLGGTDFLHDELQAYWAYHDGRCQDTSETGVLGAISKNEPKKNRFFIRTEKRIYLNALTTGIKRDAEQRWVHISCLNISSFVPRVGATYQVTQSFHGELCSLQVEDLQTGKQPASIIVEPVSKECGL